jgi:hypothetical protein
MILYLENILNVLIYSNGLRNYFYLLFISMNVRTGYIYEIVSMDGGLRFIGSSVQKRITTILGLHRDRYWRQKGDSIMAILFDAVGTKNVKINILHQIEFTHRHTLEMLKDDWIKRLDCLNRAKVQEQKEDFDAKDKAARKVPEPSDPGLNDIPEFDLFNKVYELFLKKMEKLNENKL